MDTVIEAPSKLDQLVDRYFNIRKQLDDPLIMSQPDSLARVKDALRQIEDHILANGNPGHLVRLYIAKRDDKDRMKKEYQAKVDSTDAFLAAAEGRFRVFLKEAGVNSSVTDHGTFFKKNSTSATVGDKEAFGRWLQEDPERFVFLDLKVNKTAVAEQLENDQPLPPGVNWREEEVIQVRR